MKNCMRALNKQSVSVFFKCCVMANILSGMLGGCASAPVSQLNANISATEKNALNALMLQNTAAGLRALDTAQAEYEQFDDLYGQWRIQSVKTKLALGANELTQGRTIALSLKTLAEQLNDNDVSYQTYILLGRTHQDDSYFKRALDYAATQLEQASMYAYLGDPARAVELIDPDRTDYPAERAFIYYQAGIAASNRQNFERALDYYRLAQDPRGIADTLFRLARVAAKNSDTASAIRYANRAIKSLESANQLRNAAVVRDWVRTL